MTSQELAIDTGRLPALSSETTADRPATVGPGLRIAFIAACPFPVPRGTPIRILRLAESLAAEGHEVHVITYHLGHGLVDDRVRVHRIEDIPRYRKLSPGPTIRKLVQVDRHLAHLARELLARVPFDVIHAHHYEGLLVARAVRGRRNIPIIYDAHTLLQSELPYYSLGVPGPVKRLVGRWLDHQLPRLADHTVCVTETIREKLLAHSRLRPERVTVVRNGVELEHLRSGGSPGGAQDDGARVLFTGNLAEYQGIGLLLESFAKVARLRHDACLVVVTDSSFEPYEALSRRLGIRQRVTVIPSPGFGDLPALMATAHVAVNPRTDCDGVPVKLLNYMAAGLPVVSFDSSAPGVTHGRTGWLASSGDRDAMAEGIVTLLGDRTLAREIGRAAQDYIEQHCRWGLAAARCGDIYRKLLTGRDAAASAAP